MEQGSRDKDERDSEKALAAARAVEFVRDGMSIGLGTGSTAAHVVTLLGQRVAQGLRIEGIATSHATEALPPRCVIPRTSFARRLRLDLTIDGADEIDPEFRLIKGKGGALLHEKIVAAASDKLVIVADVSKLVPILRGAVPIEVVPFGFERVAHQLKAMGGEARLRLDAAGNPYRTDEANWILDTEFGEIRNPEKLASDLDSLVGMVEHGLFLGMTDTVIVADAGQVKTLHARRVEAK